MNNLNDEFENFNIFHLAESDCDSLFEIILENLDLYQFPINSKNENGETLLHIMCKKGDFDLSKKLLSKGASANIINQKKETPLHFASTSGNLNLVKLLLKNNARFCANGRGESPIFGAVRNGHFKIFKYFIETAPKSLLQVNNEGQNLLHAAVEGGHVDMIDILIKIANFDINAPMLDGSTILHLAFANKLNFILVEELLKNGANINVQDAKCRTLLHLSVVKNNIQMCKFLIDSGAEINCKDSNGATPLHYAVELGMEKIVFLLVHNNADLNIQDTDGYTPLHLAAKLIDCDILKFLLKNHADFHLKTDNGDRPLHTAAAFGNFGAVLVLMYYSTNFKVSYLNNHNYTPANLAEINGHRKVLKLLLEPSSKIPRATRKSIFH